MCQCVPWKIRWHEGRQATPHGAHGQTIESGRTIKAVQLKRSARQRKQRRLGTDLHLVGVLAAHERASCSRRRLSKRPGLSDRHKNPDGGRRGTSKGRICPHSAGRTRAEPLPRRCWCSTCAGCTPPKLLNTGKLVIKTTQISKVQHPRQFDVVLGCHSTVHSECREPAIAT